MVTELPGPWRSFAIELSPEGITAEYGDEPRMVTRHDAAGIEARIATMQNTEAMSKFAAGIRLAKWSPRRPFGAYLNSTAVEVRNVVITPILHP
jgi:hypothetical protein